VAGDDDSRDAGDGGGQRPPPPRRGRLTLVGLLVLLALIGIAVALLTLLIVHLGKTAHHPAVPL
jgi:hypothetical protein